MMFHWTVSETQFVAFLGKAQYRGMSDWKIVSVTTCCAFEKSSGSASATVLMTKFVPTRVPPTGGGGVGALAHALRSTAVM
jgi:hypothetical protein